MRTFGTLLAAATLTASAHAQSTGNLLGNPGFEIDQLLSWGAGWGNFAANAGVWAREGGFIVTAEDGVTPNEGVRMLRLANGSGSYTQAMQPVDVGSGLAETLIATGSAQATFKARFNLEADPGTQPQAFVSIHLYADPFPAAPLLPQSSSALFVDGDPATWELAVHALDVPAATRWIVIEVSFHNVSLGALTRGYCDETSLVISVSSACVTYCDANGVDATPCPCGNDNDGLAAGCKNSQPNWMGGMLRCSGNASLSTADLVLHSSNLPPNRPGHFFQGDNAPNGGLGLVFGDGLRCASGNIIRIQLVFTDNMGRADTTVDIAAQGLVSVGDTKHYQYWYRDNIGRPCLSGYNFTNGVRILWEF